MIPFTDAPTPPAPLAPPSPRLEGADLLRDVLERIGSGEPLDVGTSLHGALVPGAELERIVGLLGDTAHVRYETADGVAIVFTVGLLEELDVRGVGIGAGGWTSLAAELGLTSASTIPAIVEGTWPRVVGRASPAALAVRLRRARIEREATAAVQAERDRRAAPAARAKEKVITEWFAGQSRRLLVTLPSEWAELIRVCDVDDWTEAAPPPPPDHGPRLNFTPVADNPRIRRIEPSDFHIDPKRRVGADHIRIDPVDDRGLPAFSVLPTPVAPLQRQRGGPYLDLGEGRLAHVLAVEAL